MSTRSDIPDPLLSVLRRIEKGHIRVDLKPAFRFLQTVHDKINIGHRRYLVDIEKCLKCVHGEESPSREEITRAIDVYNKYVSEFISEEKRKESKGAGSARDTTQNEYPIKFAAVNEPDVVDTINLSDQIPVIYEPDQIAESYMGIYKDLWNKVAGALKVKIAEHTTHKLLLEIVQKAFRECQKEKNDLLYEMNTCVGRTLFPDNKEIIDLKPGSEQESLLTMFLRSNGNLALLRLTQKFTKIIENTTLQKYNIPTVDSIFKTYVEECVRVTWSMVLTDPPVHMVYGHPDTKIDPDWYTVKQGTNQVIDQVIWPALLEYKDGPILVRGFVYCR